MLDFDTRALLREAVAASAAAHCPYSGYAVGAALLTADGQVFRGCNVENASFGLTICAERVALASAVAAGQRDFVAMAIVADGQRPPYPCGACRQVMAEFCQPEFVVCVASTRGLEDIEQQQLGALLPQRFALQP
jgi:cytidine deaminase